MRWYDPALGRFLGLDPVAFQADNIHSFNRYAYANNNPYRYVDPDGNVSVDSVNYRLQTGMQLAHPAGGNSSSFPALVQPVPGFSPPSMGGELAAGALGLAGAAGGIKELIRAGFRIVTNKLIPGFNGVESGIIREAQAILGSSEMAQIRAAHAAGESLSVNIGGRLVQYEPGLPASGMTMFGENGFLIGREAFASQMELQKTVLHELYRLNTSTSATGVSGALATQETKAAFDFAERAAKHLGGN